MNLNIHTNLVSEIGAFTLFYKWESSREVRSLAKVAQEIGDEINVKTQKCLSLNSLKIGFKKCLQTVSEYDGKVKDGC